MADYRDLLRRAIDALPENNGNSRRQVYDKARTALRKQLDAIQPELPSREKTHHRLQLEECIREVEEEATERMLSGLSHLEDMAFVAPAHESATPMAKKPVMEPVTAPEAVPEGAQSTPVVADAAEPAAEKDDASPHALGPDTEPVNADEPDDDVVEQEAASQTAPSDEPQPAPDERVDDNVSEPSVPVLDPEPISPVSDIPSAHDESAEKPESDASDAPSAENVAPDAGLPAAQDSEAAARQNPIFARFSSKLTAFGSGGAEKDKAKNDRTEPVETPEPAMSAEREVELDTERQDDPQGAIDHAIAILDREAGAEDDGAGPENVDSEDGETSFPRTESGDEGGGSPALTIFLVLVLLLLAGAGGASYWAWREGYLNLNYLFGTPETVATSEPATPPVDTTPAATEPVASTPVVVDTAEEASHPGNTTAAPDVVATPTTGLEQANGAGATAGDALAGSDVLTQPKPTMDGGDTGAGNTVSTAAADAAASVAEPGRDEDKTDQRLPIAAEEDNTSQQEVAAQTQTAPDVVSEGSQSLLLEASDQANAGAVPFSGTVDWTRGVDELGQPTLDAMVDIPARNMSVNLLIRKNSDPSLPASHLIEIDFTISDSFIGGGIARIAGILMKNEELVQGVPLVGASARIVGNNFLFALSAASQDVTSNSELLRSRKWMDLAIIYSTGKQAILTLEKDDAAIALFNEVLAAWNPAPPAGSQP